MRFKIPCMIGLLSLACASAALAADIDTDRMNQVVQYYVDQHQFTGTVLVARGDSVVFAKGYGAADLESNTANTVGTKFRIGSVTKQFTAASVLLLEERGKLKTGDRVKKYYPDAPAAWDNITLFHLLTHTSGIPNYTQLPDMPTFSAKPATPDRLVRFFRDQPLDFAPGTEMRYSNSGYALLGLIIEKVSGKSYAAFVQENIFTPLGMKDSGYESPAPDKANRASGYVFDPKEPKPADFVDMTIPYSAGALYSSVNDLWLWERQLFGGKLLSAASLAKMTTPFKNDYAFGLVVGKKFEQRVVEHGGNINGFVSQLTYFPDEQLTIAVLSNVNPASANQIADKLEALAHGQTVQLPSELAHVALTAEALRAFVGTYSLAPEFNLMIALDGDHLTAQGSGQGKLPLVANSATAFSSQGVDARIDFEKDAEGKVTQLVLHQNGRDRVGKRISDSSGERVEILVSPTKLQEFVGTYALRPGLDLVFTVTGDHLTLSPTGQPPDTLYAQTWNRFFSKRIDAQIEFDRDANGAVTGLTLHQGAFHGKAPRKP